MYIADLFETYVTEAGPQLVVLYSGRFQPFHLGHGEVFQELQSRFGRDNVYRHQQQNGATEKPF
jgi:nicotinic acid mononucleotide adenylyltransferase